MRYLFLLFIIVPIVEITLLIQVGGLIGTWYTVGLVLLSAFIGVNMLRRQSLATIARAQQRMQTGELPGQEMAEGIVIAVGGALLVTPGFVTDLIGFSCLIPFSRKAAVKALSSRFTVISSGMQQGPFSAHFHTSDSLHGNPMPEADRTEDSNSQYSQSPFRKPAPPKQSGDVIDGEYRHKE